MVGQGFLPFNQGGWHRYLYRYRCMFIHVPYLPYWTCNLGRYTTCSGHGFDLGHCHERRPFQSVGMPKKRGCGSDCLAWDRFESLSFWFFSGWWFGTSILFSHMLGIIIPIDFHIFQRGGLTTNQFCFVQRSSKPLKLPDPFAETSLVPAVLLGPFFGCARGSPSWCTRLCCWDLRWNPS